MITGELTCDSKASTHLSSSSLVEQVLQLSMGEKFDGEEQSFPVLCTQPFIQALSRHFSANPIIHCDCD